MAQQMQMQTRGNSPARWQKAAERAIAEGVQVRQLAGSGAWIASSGRDATVAYEVEVTATWRTAAGVWPGSTMIRSASTARRSTC